MHLIQVAAAFLASLAVADAAVKQCFFAAGQKALDSYVPCSSSGSHSSCCQAGDYCLADGACYGPDTKMTYIAGCTDSDFQDGSCKGGQGTCNKNTQFQGLALCGNNWVCCGGRGQQGVVPGNDYADTCPCDQGYATVIFNAGSSLPALNSLATNVPTDREQPSTAAATTSGGDSSSSSAQRTRTSSPSSAAATTTSSAPSSTISISQDGGIKGTGSGSEPAASTGGASPAPDNTKLKVGLGVGIPLAFAVIGAVAVAVFCLRRKMLGGGSPRYVTQADLSTPVWQGEVAGSGLPAAESGAYNSAGYKQNAAPGSSNGYTPMREQPTPPPQYKFGGEESSLHRPESQGILQASRNY